MLSKESWIKFQLSSSPFLNFNFMNALHTSKTIGIDSGWQEASITDEDGILLSFVKSHSYGEYILIGDGQKLIQNMGSPIIQSSHQ